MMSLARKIIHVDCDCFYAAIETRDAPALAGRPVAVGGQADRRGVIATCNYEARAFGVRSAMASAQALKRCPDLLILPGRMERYREASGQIQAIFRRYTPLIEPLSLDEAYLDVSRCDHFSGSATRIAAAIRQAVREEVGITVSAGVAPNKFLAKIASDWDKPDGLYVITPEQVDEFVSSLPVERLFGVGPATAAKLHQHQLFLCGDLRERTEQQLCALLGSFGERLYQLCRGVDERPVRTERQRKSLSVEHTYADDLPTLDACLERLPALLEELQHRLQRLDPRYAIGGAVVKVKFSDFVQTTVEQRAEAVDPLIFSALMREGFGRRQMPVRLLGLGVRLEPRQEGEPRQLGLF
ncbi:DNA polymerase IV [Motiliproteus sediminis]|uniref:DNA polymerase IV n=1 Tax=Motiliproteus sediminis TaxID=1468178 RepID=UPI001AEF6C78|nr:DNA polymerase IV [Motiliproteus sediminis]